MPGYAYNAVASSTSIPPLPPPIDPSDPPWPYTSRPPTVPGTVGTLPTFISVAVTPTWNEPVLDAKNPYLCGYWPMDEGLGTRHDIWRGNHLTQQLEAPATKINSTWAARFGKAAVGHTNAYSTAGTFETKLNRLLNSFLTPAHSFLLNMWIRTPSAAGFNRSGLFETIKDVNPPDPDDFNIRVYHVDNGAGAEIFSDITRGDATMQSSNFGAAYDSWWMFTFCVHAAIGQFMLFQNGAALGGVPYGPPLTLQQTTGTGWKLRMMSDATFGAGVAPFSFAGYSVIDEVAFWSDLPLADYAELDNGVAPLGLVQRLWNGGSGIYMR